MGLNAHRVFKSESDIPSYLAALTVDAKEEQALRSVRDDIREAVKSGLRRWAEMITKRELLEGFAADSDPVLRPKFRMQGSFSYRTCNVPAKKGQQIDLDDGVFLPVSFLSQGGEIHPAIVSRGYFAAVERAIAPLCAERSWKLITDKSSCVRIQLSETAHIDLALYAIPDQDFETLVETAMAKAFALDRAMVRKNFEDAVEFSETQYVELPEDHIMLAHREQGWKKSDPRKLEEWFRSALKDHGEQLRRICRYLKGWRDHQWQESKLASIALMSATVTAYSNSSSKPAENRDDMALLMVAEGLPTVLAQGIPNPVVKDARLDEGWSEAQRREYREFAEKLQETMRLIVQQTNDATAALSALKTSFGDRIPDDRSLISADAQSSAAMATPQVLTMGLLRDIGDTPQARQAVKLEGDGRYG